MRKRDFKQRFKRCTAAILIMGLLMNVSLPAVQARAYSMNEVMSTTGENKHDWNIAESLGHSCKFNNLENVSKEAETVVRLPDVGVINENDGRFVEWLKGIFS